MRKQLLIVTIKQGGDNAPVEQKDSIAGQLKKIEELTLKDSGCFYNFEGSHVNW